MYEPDLYNLVMIQLENEHLRVSLSSKGAELKSVFGKEHGIEYLWQADPAFWAKTSPVLFPIVGTLKENTYFYKGKAYSLPRHGFARDTEFQITAQRQDAVTCTITSDTATLAVYPFPFRFSIIYTISGNRLVVSYAIQNTGTDFLLFSVGGHPAFKVPLGSGTDYEDYQLVFEKNETTGRWPISNTGLIEKEPQPLLDNTSILKLKKALFQKDALVFKQLQSQWIKLTSAKTTHGLQFSFTGFPYLGLWAAPGADFLCIEPWCGIADSVDADQQLEHKEGIRRLPPGETFEASWQVQFY